MAKLKDTDLISLKEAAEVSGYSADYIGQLIRKGKIPGKQVYTNISWMTTAQAVLEYKATSKRSKKPTIIEQIKNRRRQMMIEVSVIKTFFQTFRSALPILLIMLVSFVVLVTFIIYNLLAPPAQLPAPSQPAETPELVF